MLLELQNQEKWKVGDVCFSVLRGWAEDACVLVWCVGLFLPCYADRSSNLPQGRKVTVPAFHDMSL